MRTLLALILFACVASGQTTNTILVETQCDFCGKDILYFEGRNWGDFSYVMPQHQSPRFSLAWNYGVNVCGDCLIKYRDTVQTQMTDQWNKIIAEIKKKHEADRAKHEKERKKKQLEELEKKMLETKQEIDRLKKENKP